MKFFSAAAFVAALVASGSACIGGGGGSQCCPPAQPGCGNPWYNLVWFKMKHNFLFSAKELDPSMLLPHLHHHHNTLPHHRLEDTQLLESKQLIWGISFICILVTHHLIIEVQINYYSTQSFSDFRWFTEVNFSRVRWNKMRIPRKPKSRLSPLFKKPSDSEHYTPVDGKHQRRKRFRIYPF